MAKKRKNFTPAEKVKILKSHLVDKIPVSDLCDNHGMHPTVFYRWQKAFFEKGNLAFEKQTLSKTRVLEAKISQLEGKLIKKNEIVSELMEEHVALKKSLGEI